MLLKKRIKKIFDAISGAAIRRLGSGDFVQKLLISQGVISARQISSLKKIESLADVEFSIFSQWGEDGIIEWLVQTNVEMPNSFVEFGVESYREANTRFLLCHRNWRGLIIDGSASNIAAVRDDNILWRYDLTATNAFITRENINGLIQQAGFEGEIGILSVDIDGNDYWVWKAIECVSPHIVIIEYNAVFGDRYSLTIPYDPEFFRTKAHYSNLYFGASIVALSKLAAEKGYTLLGSNLAGGNAFFIRNDRLPRFADRIVDRTARPSRFREGRDAKGNMSFVRGRGRAESIADCTVTDLTNGTSTQLGSFGELYSERWSTLIT